MEDNKNTENIISESDDNKTSENEPKSKMSGKKKALIISGSIVGALAVLAAAAVGIIYHYIGKLNIVEDSGVDVSSVLEDYAESVGKDLDSSEAISMMEEDLAEDDSTDSEDTDSETVVSYNTSNEENYNQTSLDIMSSPDVTNVLLIGTDARSTDEQGRSDSMILLSVNESTKKLTMFSFLRDIYIYIPGVGSTRLNHSYAYGGAELTMQTIEQNFGIEIDKYVQVNFFSFIKVVDAVGGVDISVTDDEAVLINQYLDEINDLLGEERGTDSVSGGGDLHLNGKQALCYSRIRYIGTDFARTSRQRTVLNQVMNKAVNMSASELSDFLNEVLPLVTTNLSSSEIFSLLLSTPTYLTYSRISDSIPLSGTYSFMTVRGMSVIGIDFSSNISALRKEIYG